LSQSIHVTDADRQTDTITTANTVLACNGCVEPQ